MHHDRVFGVVALAKSVVGLHPARSAVGAAVNALAAAVRLGVLAGGDDEPVGSFRVQDHAVDVVTEAIDLLPRLSPVPGDQEGSNFNADVDDVSF